LVFLYFFDMHFLCFLSYGILLWKTSLDLSSGPGMPMHICDLRDASHFQATLPEPNLTKFLISMIKKCQPFCGDGNQNVVYITLIILLENMRRVELILFSVSPIFFINFFLFFTSFFSLYFLQFILVVRYVQLRPVFYLFF